MLNLVRFWGNNRGMKEMRKEGNYQDMSSLPRQWRWFSTGRELFARTQFEVFTLSWLGIEGLISPGFRSPLWWSTDSNNPDFLSRLRWWKRNFGSRRLFYPKFLKLTSSRRRHRMASFHISQRLASNNTRAWCRVRSIKLILPTRKSYHRKRNCNKEYLYKYGMNAEAVHPIYM